MKTFAGLAAEEILGAIGMAEDKKGILLETGTNEFEIVEFGIGDVNYGINVATVTNILNSNKLVLVIAAMILAGSLIGTLSARLALHKYLRNPSK